MIAYALAGNERSWTAIPAYTLAGERVTLAPKHAPDVPVLVISRALTAVPWVLVYTVSYDEALGAAELHRSLG